MDLVVDTNILLACLKPDSFTRKIMANENLHLFATEYQLSELNEYVIEVS